MCFRRKEQTVEEIEAIKRAKLLTAQETGYFVGIGEMEELNIKIELAKLKKRTISKINENMEELELTEDIRIPTTKGYFSICCGDMIFVKTKL